MAQWVKCWQCKHEDLSSEPSTQEKARHSMSVTIVLEIEGRGSGGFGGLAGPFVLRETVFRKVRWRLIKEDAQCTHKYLSPHTLILFWILEETFSKSIHLLVACFSLTPYPLGVSDFIPQSSRLNWKKLSMALNNSGGATWCLQHHLLPEAPIQGPWGCKSSIMAKVTLEGICLGTVKPHSVLKSGGWETPVP